MILNLQQIKNITRGTERITEQDGAYRFYRFNEIEEKLYSSSPLFPKTYAPAGVRMEFKTDARSIALEINAYEKTSRTYFAFDIVSNNELIGCIKNYPDDVKNGVYPSEEFPLGKYSGVFPLEDGEKHIKIFFPWSIPCELKKFELCNASYITPVRAEKKALIYGDSITQGYDTLNPSLAYSVQLCDLLGAEGINKAIGGEIFIPELAEIKSEISPDYVTAAYGINDWARDIPEDEFKDNCRRFWEAICKNYPTAKKFAITPIWYDNNEKKQLGYASEVDKAIRDALSSLPGITVIRGWDLVPHDNSLFGDECLHPNAAGFKHYFDNLKKEIEKHI